MDRVRAKKHLGQHFLKDLNIAERITTSMGAEAPKMVLEIGPGMGVLTQFLLKNKELDLHLVEIDRASVAYLKKKYPELENKIVEGDFLRMDLAKQFSEPFAVIGNFPYNISSQILFKLIENKDLIPELVGMFQKEVAERVAAGPGSKTYGVISVLLQAYYNIDYLFTVHENVFDPPPKVKSGVIRVYRNDRDKLPCDEKLFKRIVKVGFNQRRKTLSNSLKSILLDSKPQNEVFRKRPEQLSVQEFIELTNLIEKLIAEKS
ncbi:MAG: 16S rRNA (adenine(1518)-N(6)/adenine(1519)-N(6))-dimethyltransferase RsmA [Salinivirgaceae bacterium]|nr:16S rRNA (adenine(1518)-N(6)/adenine(1519)-N(6))-dimethyltransferase RsmA [Salinivirgaceae bacterium]